MQFTSPNFRCLAVVLALLTGCDTSEHPTMIRQSHVDQAAVSASTIVPAHKFDTPGLRTWHVDPLALRRELDASQRAAIVVLKSPTSRRALEMGGLRAPLSLDDFRLGLATLAVPASIL